MHSAPAKKMRQQNAEPRTHFGKLDSVACSQAYDPLFGDVGIISHYGRFTAWRNAISTCDPIDECRRVQTRLRRIKLPIVVSFY
jgi:hypothetical protein